MAELAFEEGDWADCVLRGYPYDNFGPLRLVAIEDSSYPPVADRVGKGLGEEHYHRDQAGNCLERLTEGKDDSSEGIRARRATRERGH